MMRTALRSRARPLLFALALLAAALGVSPPSPALAQEEARLLFERGNQHLARGLRARGRTRERELTEAIDAYLGVLRLGARTRNVVFNLGLAHQELGRADDAFNYFGEYLRAFDLGADERTAGEQRLEALRPRVAVARLESTPPGAEVRVGRRDLPVRGTTPLALALPAGEHELFLTRQGFAEATARVSVRVGTSTPLSVSLEPLPVDVQIIAPPDGRLTLDGQPIEAGRTHRVPPGGHVIRLELPGVEPLERRFEAAPGDPPLVLELSGPAGRVLDGQVALEVDLLAEVVVDGVRIDEGPTHVFPLAPGLHELRVSAPGRAPLVHALRLEPGERIRLAVELGLLPDATGVHAARAVLGTLAALSLITSAALGARALSLSDEWNAALAGQAQGPLQPERLEGLAEQVEHGAVMTDVAFGVTAGLGLGALVSLLVQPSGGTESAVRVLAAPSAEGGVLGLAWRSP
jgi:outer membrane receptor for ferrienterochelin and colicins